MNNSRKIRQSLDLDFIFLRSNQEFKEFDGSIGETEAPPHKTYKIHC